MSELPVGTKVRRVDSDYQFEGTVVAVFTKLSGVTRYVVEDDRGMLFIWKRENMEESDNRNTEAWKCLRDAMGMLGGSSTSCNKGKDVS